MPAPVVELSLLPLERLREMGPATDELIALFTEMRAQRAHPVVDLLTAAARVHRSSRSLLHQCDQVQRSAESANPSEFSENPAIEVTSTLAFSLEDHLSRSSKSLSAGPQ